jgi:phosphate starvation-inducible protein PhoH
MGKRIVLGKIDFLNKYSKIKQPHMTKVKHKQQQENQDAIDDHYKTKTRRTGITKLEWERIKEMITLTEKQNNLYKGIRNNTLTICQGPAGTSKTFSACFACIGLLVDKKIDRIILTKPIQESGENLGFLPGTVEEKTDPYMQSYFSNFKKILGNQIFEFLKATGAIVVEPLAYMRGTTYDDAIMLLDEAQNCTMHQLMLWATRLGRNSKAVMMGDVSQYDIKKKDSKFLDFISIITGEYNFKEDDVADITGYKTLLGDVYYHKFNTEDIVRNKFLIDLVNRYEKYKFQNNL